MRRREFLAKTAQAAVAWQLLQRGAFNAAAATGDETSPAPFGTAPYGRMALS